jgi:hypothetical protein
MASSRRASKSDSSSKSSSGNNSKRNSLSNDSSSSSFSTSKEEILDLGFTDNIDDAEKNMKNWLMKEMKEPKGKWVPHWGTKFTEGAKSNKGLANLGRVIGQDFITESKPHAKEQKIENSNFRVDWDTTKGKHYNAVLRAKINDRYIAYPFGKLEADLQPHPITKKAIGEQTVIYKMLTLTAAALSNDNLMTPENAQKILKTFENPATYAKEYFKESGSVLRQLISQAHEVILQSNKAKTDDSYKFDALKLSDRVSEYLHEVWSPTVNEQLQSIFSGSPPVYKDRNVLQVLLTECVFAASEDKLSGKVLNQFSEILLPLERQHVISFLNNLKDYANPEQESALEKFQEKILILRRSISPISPDSKSDQPPKSSSSTASAMLTMMSSRNQATQALKQTLQTSGVTSEATIAPKPLPSVAQISSAMSQATINNAGNDNKEDKNVSTSTRRFR